jgi:hypothetical protein
VPTKRAEKKLVELLVAEMCLNLDLEVIKLRLESASEFTKMKSERMGILPDFSCRDTFSTEHVFTLIDVRGYKYLDMEGIRIFMELYFNHLH